MVLLFPLPLGEIEFHRFSSSFNVLSSELPLLAGSLFSGISAEIIFFSGQLQTLDLNDPVVTLPFIVLNCRPSCKQSAGGKEGGSWVRLGWRGTKR